MVIYRYEKKEVLLMARSQRHYDLDYKVQAVSLAKEIGLSNAARELGISPSTLNGWEKATHEGRLISAPGSQTPAGAMSLAEEVQMLRKQVKDLNKENKRLKEENEFLEEASAFFAASRRKSAKTSD